MMQTQVIKRVNVSIYLIIIIFTNKTLDAKIKNEKLVKEPDIFEFTKYNHLAGKIKKLATKAQLKADQDTIVTLQTFDLGYFLGKSHFGDDGTPNYLVHQPIKRSF